MNVQHFTEISTLNEQEMQSCLCVIGKHLRNPFMVSLFTNECSKHGKNKKPNARKTGKIIFRDATDKTKSLLRQERIILHALRIIGDD